MFRSSRQLFSKLLKRCTLAFISVFVRESWILFIPFTVQKRLHYGHKRKIQWWRIQIILFWKCCPNFLTKNNAGVFIVFNSWSAPTSYVIRKKNLLPRWKLLFLTSTYQTHDFSYSYRRIQLTLLEESYCGVGVIHGFSWSETALNVPIQSRTLLSVTLPTMKRTRVKMKN